MPVKVLAITGSYRRDGVLEAAVEAVLAGARERGAETATIRLQDHPIEFCSHCRACTQEAGPRRGACVQQDGLEAILRQVDAADALVLGSPVSFYNTTALFRRFMERLVGNAHWPWGQAAPSFRAQARTRKAILVASSAAPALFLPLATGVPRALKLTAKVLGAKPAGSLWIGLAAREPHPSLGPRTLARARSLGGRLA